MSFQIDKLRTQADEQEKTLLAQEEEVHGKKRAYEKLKEEEKEMRTDIRDTEKEIQRLADELKLIEELNEEVGKRKL